LNYIIVARLLLYIAFCFFVLFARFFSFTFLQKPALRFLHVYSACVGHFIRFLDHALSPVLSHPTLYINCRPYAFTLAANFFNFFWVTFTTFSLLLQFLPMQNQSDKLSVNFFRKWMNENETLAFLEPFRYVSNVKMFVSFEELSWVVANEW